MLLFTLVLFTLPLTMVSLLSPEGNFVSANAIATANIAKPGCKTRCGNLTVRYPFCIGIGKGCSIDESFDLYCDSTRNPPKLFYGSGSVEIYNISDSEMRVSTSVTYTCYNKFGVVIDEFIGWNNFENTPFTYSEKNKLTVIGCDDLALITEANGAFSSGCMGLCSNPEVVPSNYCTGIGCCQTFIPKGLKFYNVTLRAFQNHKKVFSFNRCGFAFLGEGDSFQFRGVRDLYNASEFFTRTVSIARIVLDWVIGGNRSCTEATECKGNSSCNEADIGGYRCSCNKGYEGNPYLDPGCQALTPTAISNFISGLEQLNGTNFATWRDQIKISLGIMDLDYALRFDPPAPLTANSTVDQKRIYEIWERSNRMSLMIMKNSISTAIRGAIPESENAKEFLASVEEQFKGSSKAHASTLILKMLTTKYDGVSGVREHIMMMNDMASKLKGMDMEISEGFLVHFIMTSLPVQFGPFKINYNTQKEKWKMSE